MRIVAQRVTRANVSIAGEVVGQIGGGCLLLVGVTQSDKSADAAFMARKIANLRVFDDEDGNLNRSLLDIATTHPESAGLLVVSQFTLYADARKGRRPSFTHAAHPDHAKPLIAEFITALTAFGLHVEQGQFGADMAVELVNDGPVTIWLDTAELRS